MVGSRQILSHSSAAVRTRSFAASSFVGLAGSSLSNQGASGNSYECSALDVEHAADLPRHHGLTSQDDGQQERSRPDDFSHGHTGATSPASGSARLTGGSHTRPANSSLAAHGCYRVIGPARICKRGDTLVAHLFPGARLELLDRDGNATALLLQQQAAAAVQPQPLTATDATAALPVSYGSGGSSTAVGSMGSGGGSGDSAWSAGASLFSIADDEDVPPPLPAAAAALAPAPMASSPAATTTAAAPPPLAAPPLMMSSGVGGGIGGGIGGGRSAGGGAFPAAAGSAQQAEAEAQRVVEECVLVAAHVELGGSASSVDLVDVGLQPALHRHNGHIYLSVRCLPPCAQFELGPNAHLCHPISMTPPADTCC